MWIRYINVLLLLLPHMFCSPTFLTSEDLISKAKKKHHNSTLDNTSDKQGKIKVVISYQ